MEQADPNASSVLIVDDDGEILHSLQEQLSWEGYEVVTSASALAALERIAVKQFAVVLSDQVMPDMTGLEFLARVRELQPDASRVLITAVYSLDTLIHAINESEIFRFLPKPWTRAELLATVRNASQRYHLVATNRSLRETATKLNSSFAMANAELQARIDQLTAKNQELDYAHASLDTNFQRSLELCYRIISTFHPLLGSQTKNVVELCKRMAETTYFNHEERHVLVAAAWLHDIGLIGLERDVLHKMHTDPGLLTEREEVLVRNHPVYGQSLAAFVNGLTSVGVTIRAHHERFDGTGFPDGLAGQNIPWTARCLAVVVHYVESGLSHDAALENILNLSGTAFDPEAVRLFSKITSKADSISPVREVMLDELEPGMRLAKGVYSPTGILLVAEDQPLSPAVINKLRNHNMQASVTGRLLVYS